MFNFIKNIFVDIKNDKFKLFSLTVCVLIFLSVLFQNDNNTNKAQASDINKVILFHSPTCPHCRDAKAFINSNLKEEYPDIKFKLVNVQTPRGRNVFNHYVNKLNIEGNSVPVAVFGDDYIMGYGGDDTTGVNYKLYIENMLGNTKQDTEDTEKKTSINNDPKELSSDVLKTKYFGDISLKNTSLTSLSILLGFIDGFNPCAMWVLVFIISIILELRDKKKIWFVVGSFLFAEAVLYYMFMAFWMNTLAMMGHIMIINAFIGCIAIYIALTSFNDFYKGHVECKVDDLQKRQTIKGKIHNVVSKPLTFMSIIAMVGLAASVNMVEFACSSAIPVIYTKVLVESGISTFARYAYMALYNLFYMIDDFIIFGFAVFAVNKYLGDKYVRWCKLFAGVILLVLGVIMVFFPELLR